MVKVPAVRLAGTFFALDALQCEKPGQWKTTGRALDGEQILELLGDDVEREDAWAHSPLGGVERDAQGGLTIQAGGGVGAYDYLQKPGVDPAEAVDGVGKLLVELVIKRYYAEVTYPDAGRLPIYTELDFTVEQLLERYYVLVGQLN